MTNTRPVVFSMNFRLNKQRSKTGSNVIYVRITVDNKRVELATRFRTMPRQWNQKLQLIIGDNVDSKEINKQLSIIKADILKHYNRMLALDKTVTAELLKNEYLGITERRRTLKELMDFYHNRFKEKVISGKKSKNTLKCIYTTIEKLKEFLKYRFGVTDMALDEIKVSFTNDFEHFLTAKQGLSNNSAMKYIRILKRITKFAVDQGWIITSPVAQFRCSYQEPERERLTMEEIMTLYKKDLDLKRLSEVRDVFVFCCFTGFSYMDVYKLTPQHIVTGIDGGKWIVKDREKTKSSERVPLLPIPLEIIERYKNDYYCETKNCLLPVNTNQCYNAYLKEIAIVCKINKHLTTHIARHSFATSVTLENDVPIETVSQMLGHKSIRTTQIYAKVTQRKISNNMRELENKLMLQTNNTALTQSIK
jgi:site-specific recombinase XerD